MAKILYCLWAFLFFVGSAFALNNGDIIQIEYDLQGGINNPNNASSYAYNPNSAYYIYLLPATREGYEFLGWYKKTSDNLLASNSVWTHIDPRNGQSNAPNGKISFYARWGVPSKIPQRDVSGCMLVHDAAELYGAVKVSDSLTNNYEKACIFIENDIVVNKNLLAADGSPNEGEHYWWKAFDHFSGVIEGNGHTISGLYGDVGLIDNIFDEHVSIQNLGIIDSYFSGDDYVGSFVARLSGYGLALKNVYSTATVVGYGKYEYVGGLIGYLDAMGDACLDVIDVIDVPVILERAPLAYDHSYYYYNRAPFMVTVENAYFAGHLAGKLGGGLVGVSDNISFKNAFFAGTSDVENFSVISMVMSKGCYQKSPDDISAENTFYLNGFEADDFNATAASAAEFANGTVLEKLVNGSEYPVWTQKIGNAYPRLNGVFYDIIYRLNGGDNSSENPAYCVPGQAFTLLPATKDGDVFEGWFADTNFTIPVEKIAATEEGNQKFYAKWKNGYSITYVHDGSYGYGSYSPNPTYRYADSATFVLKEPEGSGRTFEGWYSDSTFTTRVTKLLHGNTEDIVLYAKWSGGEVKLIYDLNGGTMGNAKNPETVLNGETIQLKNPTRDGFVFRGWCDGNKQFHETKCFTDQPYFVYSAFDEVRFYATWAYAPVKPAIDAEGCYLVTNANELYYFDPYVNDVKAENLSYKPCIKIMNDIVVNPEIAPQRMSAIEWDALNTIYPFVGVIHGNGFTISGLYMGYYLTDPGNFYGIVSNDDYNGEYPEIWNLGMIYFRYGNTSYAYRVVINSKGGKTSIPRAVPTPLKVDRARKYDIKGRSPKSRPHYGVYF